MTITAQCPFCDWAARQSTGKQDERLVESYLAKALMGHLRVKHAPHEPGRVDNVQFSSGFGAASQQGFVEFSINNEVTQMEVAKAREVHRMLGEAIEAAVTDAMIHHFFKTRLDITDENRLAQILYDFREVRQGSKERFREQ
jgi:hypothetical protein